ncbi:MAG: ABC transporter [Gammaproteobacteria bacterium]|nr:ABC transporter [Gammaproteobacteria bacterium]
MIEVQNVSKTFGDVTAVHDVSFTARDGEVTGLLGPNGAGKSTTLRVIYGVIKPTGGSASVDGINVTERPLEAQRRMGILPDRVGLYSRLTAREHLRYFGRLQHLEANSLESRIDELVRLLDMQGIADRRAEGYSQGERMKVCLGRALLHEPGNVLLDEPTNGLDVMTTRTVRELIGELRRRSVNVLFSSHLMHEVARLCDHIVIVAQGTVVASGTTDEIRAAAEDDNLEEAFVKLVERSYLN